MNYFQLKYYVGKSFYEYVLEENYTFEQSVSRCLYDYYAYIEEDNIEALVVYSTLLSHIARYSPKTLALFQKEKSELHRLFQTLVNLEEYTEDEISDLKEDIALIQDKF